MISDLTLFFSSFFFFLSVFLLFHITGLFFLLFNNLNTVRFSLHFQASFQRMKVGGGNEKSCPIPTNHCHLLTSYLSVCHFNSAPYEPFCCCFFPPYHQKLSTFNIHRRKKQCCDLHTFDKCRRSLDYKKNIFE